MLLNFLTPYYTTPKRVLKKFVKTLNLDRSNSFVDLGTGDGRVIFSVYDTYKCKCTGYEISPILLLWLKLYSFLRYPFNRKINIEEESFFKADLSQYDTIYCCLPEDILEILREKFKKELKKDSVVYSYKTKIPQLKGKEIEIDNRKVYMYTF